jgi:hypothetical protein
MCTVTWRSARDGYEVLMNRDELYSRGESQPPRVTRDDGCAFVAPRDADAGGSWIAANDHGITVCLLNHYPSDPGPVPAEPRSRGHLLMDAARLHSPDEIDAMLRSGDLGIYRPFTLLVFEANGDPVAHRWDGRALRTTAGLDAPVTSSSFEPARVLPTRTQTYARLVGGDPTTASLLAYHRSHEPERGPASVCVHRPDGGSRAFSHVTVDRETVRFAHHNGPPCEPAPSSVVDLGRAG